MKQVICTISTYTYLPKVEVLYQSLKDNTHFDFYCLVIDEDIIDNKDSGIHYLTLREIKECIPSSIYTKYKNDALRWATKTLLMQFLMAKGFEKIVYVDNDIYFFDSPKVIFERLEKKSFLLTPHFYQSVPNNHARWFEANFRVGLYNAGFIACTSESLDILKWWQTCCEYNIKKRFRRGLFDDQKYLDLVPVLFDHVEVVKDRSWNMAGWNDLEFDHIQTYENHLVRPLFVHFTKLTMEKWREKDHPLRKYYQHYVGVLENKGFPLTFSRKKHLITEYFRYIYWKIERAFEK